MGLFSKLNFIFNNEKIVLEALKKMNSHIDQSEYSQTNYNKISIIYNDFKKNILSAKNADVINELVFAFIREVDSIETIIQEQNRIKLEEERIHQENLKRQQEILEHQKKLEEERRIKEEKKRIKAIEKAKKREIELKRLEEQEKQRLIRAKTEYRELIEVCNNVLRFIDYIDIDIKKIYTTITLSAPYVKIFNQNPIDAIRIIPGLDECECLDLMVIIADIDYINSNDEIGSIKRHIYNRKQNYKFSEKTWEMYKAMKRVFLLHGYDVTEIRRNNKKMKNDYLTKKYGIDQSFWKNDNTPKLPEGWMWLSELGETKIVEVDDNLFYDEGEEDKDDYINTYFELYLRHLNGEYFYPDEDYDDVINLPIIEKEKRLAAEVEWREIQEEKENKNFYWRYLFDEFDFDDDDDDDIF